MGEFLDGLPETQMFKLHQEANRAAIRAAAETMVKLFRLAYRKRRRFFVVEWAAGFKIPAALGQGDPCIDELYDVGTREQFIDKLPGNFATHRLSHLVDH